MGPAATQPMVYAPVLQDGLAATAALRLISVHQVRVFTAHVMAC
jgi:hypothetical protein